MLERVAQMLFVVDFDGTIAPTDTVDALLDGFANSEWQRIEECWVRGEIDSRQCMAAQIALVKGDEEALNGFLRSVEIDPSFASFVDYVKDFAELAVISDGLDYPIRHALRGIDVPVPIYANRMSFRPGGLDISFPHFDSACAVGSGVCKCAAARRLDAGRGLPMILIGDGRSDLCVARAADHVFAKGTLRTFCQTQNINHSPFQTFEDVLTVVRRWNVEEGIRESECPVISV